MASNNGDNKGCTTRTAEHLDIVCYRRRAIIIHHKSVLPLLADDLKEGLESINQKIII